MAETVNPPSLLQQTQQDSDLRVLPPLLQNVMIRNPGILQQVFKDVFLLDEHLHFVAVRLQGSDGVLVVMKVGRVAEIYKDSHDIKFS